MAIRYLKDAKSAADRAEDDSKVRDIVEDTLRQIETGGDATVRALSEKFDNYAPASFKLSQSDIDALMAKVSPRDMEDIKFAQEQVRNFVQA